MLQDQDFGSDSSDDDDYVPTNEGRESGNDLSSGPEETDGELCDDPVVKPTGQGKSKKKKSSAKPKLNRRVNPLLAQLQQNTEADTEKDVDWAASEKNVNKVEEIWADFLVDTEEKKTQISRPKKKSWAALLGNAKSKPVPVTTISTTAASTSSSSSSSLGASSSTLPSNPATLGTAPTAIKTLEAPTTVKITKIFEFAGEEVRVEEEVAADSSEAVAAAAAQNISSTSRGVGVPVKRSRGLSSLVSNLVGKKQKLSTLEKTKLDWQSYKQEEGLEDELLLHTKSKDTYIDKQEFLQRADVRQFEHEREVRLGSRRANR